MAVNMVDKQTGFVQRYSSAASGLLAVVDQLILLNKEFSDNFYGTGGANAITDPIVQSVLPASTAALFNTGEAAAVAVLNTVASNRGSLEWMRK